MDQLPPWVTRAITTIESVRPRAPRGDHENFRWARVAGDPRRSVFIQDVVSEKLIHGRWRCCQIWWFYSVEIAGASYRGIIVRFPVFHHYCGNDRSRAFDLNAARVAAAFPTGVGVCARVQNVRLADGKAVSWRHAQIQDAAYEFSGHRIFRTLPMHCRTTSLSSLRVL